MANKNLAFLLLPLGVLIGLGIGILFGGDSPKAAEPRLAGGAGPQASPTAAGPRAEDAAPTALRAAPVTLEAGFSPAVDGAQVDSAVRRALGAVESPRASSGSAKTLSGKLSGSVLTLEGTPLQGVTLSAVPVAAENSGLQKELVSPRLKDAASSLEEQARRLLADQARALRTTSDVRGAFELRVADDQVYSLSAECPGWVVERTNEGNSRAIAGDRVEFLARALAQVELDLVDAAGKPIDEAVLALCEDNRGWSYWRYVPWKRSEPIVAFPPGGWRVVALTGAAPWCPDRQVLWLAEARSEHQRLSLEPSAVARQLRWEVRPRPTLYGKLTSETEGRPAPKGFSLSLKGAGRSSSSDFDLSERGRRFESAHFLMLADEPGDYTLAWRREEEEKDQELAQVSLSAGNLRRDFTVSPAAERQKLYLTVTLPDGSFAASLGELQFQMQNSTGSSSGGSGSNAAMLVGPGRFELRPPDFFAPWFAAAEEGKDKGDKGSCTIDHPEYGSWKVDFKPGQSEYTLQFSQPARLTVDLRGATPAEENHFYHLTLNSKGSNLYGYGRNQLTPEVAPNGTWSGAFERLQPGDYSLNLQYNKGTSRSYRHNQLMSVDVRVAAGENHQLLDLALLSDLRIRVPDAEGSSVSLGRSGDEDSFRGQSTKQAEVGEDGLARFEKVSPGDYLVSVNGDFMFITCPAAEVLFQPQEPNAIRVMIWGEDSEMGAAGLLGGDLITAFDGAPIGKQSLGDLRASGKGGDAGSPEVQVTLKRDGRVMNLSVPRAALSGNEGGWLDPTLTR